MPGAWSQPITAPFNVGLMLLLTDGSVLAQNAGTSLWWRLRPDRAGRYAQGEWRPTGASASAPLYFASAVLADGSVFLAGGKYSNHAVRPADLCSAERYDPVQETWRTLPTPAGWMAIGDAPCCVLTDGRVLLGDIRAGPCAIFDPGTETWTATAAKLNNSSDGETWTLLPDGSVLTVDRVGQSGSERFYNGAWSANGELPADHVEASSPMIGPAVLLADGTVFALGAAGATARFTPNAEPSQAGTWTSGPTIPLGPGDARLGAKDAPACLLPNGRLLCAVGPVDGGQDSPLGPTTFLEFDPAGPGAWSAPLPPPPGDAGLAPRRHIFLLLPNGQVLVSNGTSGVQMFQPDGAADPAWTPTIADCPASFQAGSVQRLQGSQLNGLSQACAHGDGAAMATNYPLVRLRAPFPSDTVVYCRTFQHSTMGVATGRALHETRFQPPADMAPGVYHLSVIANGIASVETPVNVSPARPPRRSHRAAGAEAGEPQTFGEEELFLRDLSEVHLLIDFVSGRTDKSLDSLEGVNGVASRGAGAPRMSPQDVVEEICKISYPPTGTLEANAEQAAFMLVVKDKLNFLARPAKGLTVAFTSMFAGVSLKFERKPRSAWNWLLAQLLRPPWCWENFARAALDPRQANGEASRRQIFYAREAYPNLEYHARRFRSFYDRLPIYALICATLIAYINWDISVASSNIKHIADARADYNVLFSEKQNFLPTRPACAVYEQGASPTDGADRGSQTVADGQAAVRRVACDRANSEFRQLRAGRNALSDTTQYGFILRPVALAIRMYGATMTAKPWDERNPCGTRQAGCPGALAQRYVEPSTLETMTVDVINGYNTIVIPTIFGLLGTLTGLMRSITTKVRESTLAPRDHMVSRVGMPLGMSAGLAVGLFFNRADTSGAIAQTLGNNISVSAAGLSFLAGFGAEAFFTFLDGLLVRLFGSTSNNIGAAPAKGAG
jgi:hypothetical protein